MTKDNIVKDCAIELFKNLHVCLDCVQTLRSHFVEEVFNNPEYVAYIEKSRDLAFNVRVELSDLLLDGYCKPLPDYMNLEEEKEV